MWYMPCPHSIYMMTPHHFKPEKWNMGRANRGKNQQDYIFFLLTKARLHLSYSIMNLLIVTVLFLYVVLLLSYAVLTWSSSIMIWWGIGLWQLIWIQHHIHKWISVEWIPFILNPLNQTNQLIGLNYFLVLA